MLPRLSIKISPSTFPHRQPPPFFPPTIRIRIVGDTHASVAHTALAHTRSHRPLGCTLALRQSAKCRLLFVLALAHSHTRTHTHSLSPRPLSAAPRRSLHPRSNPHRLPSVAVRPPHCVRARLVARAAEEWRRSPNHAEFRQRSWTAAAVSHSRTKTYWSTGCPSGSVPSTTCPTATTA